MRIVAMLGVAVLVAGCHSQTFDVSRGESWLVEAKHRAILSVERPVFGSEGQPVLNERGRPVTSVSVCAEPSPDALQSTALALGADLSAEALNALFKASYMRSETQEYVGLRTQTIQLLRDAYFRLCEAFMNDGIDAIAYDVLQRRFQSQIVALLAVEQLTGAVVAGRRGDGENPATLLARITGALEESEATLRDLLQEQGKATELLSGLEAEKDGENGKKEHEAQVAAAREALEAVKEQVERRQQVTGLLRNSFAIAARRTASRNGAESAGGSTATSGGSSDSGVAEAVRAITLNAINQDYESQVCFETLRYHNHLGQFRNDVNNAFDSVGIPTNLPEGAFLEHCRNLFASQADFRNARVGAAEAFADAIREVTGKIATGEVTADEAAIYIRALANAVPIEPGVAFLSQDPKGGSVRSPVGSKPNIDDTFEVNASIEEVGAADSLGSNQKGDTQ